MNVALGSAGVISDRKLFTDTTRKIKEIPKALLELELVRITNQLIQIKAGNLLKEKRIKEFTDSCVFWNKNRVRNRILEAENPINSIKARICGGQCTIDQFYESNKLLTDIYLSPPDVSKRRGFRAWGLGWGWGG